jgi:hypothetical protein
MVKSNKAGYIWKTVGYVRTYKQSSFGTKYYQTSNQQSKAEKEASSSTRKQKANNVISTPNKA